MPNNTLSAIICFQLEMKAVHSVINPNKTVVQLKNIGGPTNLIAIVAGNWAHIEATVKMNIATENLFPVSPRSSGIEVTAADESIPLSSRFKLHRIPAIVHSLRSIFNLMARAR